MSENKETKKVKPLKLTDPPASPFYSKCFVCGDDNPAGLHLKTRCTDGKARMEFVPTDDMTGLTTEKHSIMHGGFTGMLCDEVMSYVIRSIGLENVTLNLNIDYVSPAYTGHHMSAEAQVEKKERKKIWTSAVVRDDDTGKTVAEAKGLYYAVDLRKFIDGE